VAEEPDFVARHGMMLGLRVQARTVLVEGTTDSDLFELAARVERQKTGIDLMGDGLAIVAAGEGDRGGVDGVLQQLTGFRFMARSCLLPNGRPKYRFIGLFDNDRAGRQAVKRARDFDRSIVEYRDVFRLFPVMPVHGDRDPTSLQRKFESENSLFKGLDWELEDLFPQSFCDAFASSCPGGIARVDQVNGRIHRELTRDGKARFHRFVKEHAMHDDLQDVVAVMKSVRFYLGMKDS
jgi:hypothetical protein